MRGDSQPQDLATTVLQYQQSIKQLERNGWNHEQVHRRNAVGMIAQERPPALRWRSPMLGQGGAVCGVQEGRCDLRGVVVVWRLDKWIWPARWHR